MRSNDLKCIDPATLDMWLKDPHTLLVDVREAGEHAREHIRGALSMPLSQLDAAALPRFRRIVLCCASGCRSRTAARRLGLGGLAHLEGGIAAWIEAGLPLVRRPQSRLSAARSFGYSVQLA